MSKIFRKYYFDVNIYNLALSIVFGYYYGTFYGLLIYGTFGTLVGILNFRFIKKDEYYMYQNLGISKSKLIRKVWIINLAITLPLLLTALFISK